MVAVNMNACSDETEALEELTGWGLYPRVLSRVISPKAAELSSLAERRMIARGQGRSYGDAALLSDGTVILSEGMDRIINFDSGEGILTAEAGLTLDEVIRSFLPLGWFPAVTPGTKFVSLGGCVAADVHGKNHHRDGGFGSHVLELGIVLASGEEVNCSPSLRPELFWATVGGMGLTGIITTVSIRLRPVESGYVAVRHRKAANLNELMDRFEDPSLDDDYTVAWIDCMAPRDSFGRGVYMAGHHASREEIQTSERRTHPPDPRSLSVPFPMPKWLLSRPLVHLYNEIFFRVQGAKRRPFFAPYDSFFYPLDRVENWNRLYGKRGFLQDQCVLPTDSAREGLTKLLSRIEQSGLPTFLAVLKRFGPQEPGLLSFPAAGYTLALDLPMRGVALFELLDRLDEIVLDFGGRVYLAKDARLSAASFSKMYPRLNQWRQVKAEVDPDNRFTSNLAQRIGLA
jgi:FAD/FMN-containing dehydrogenase